MPLASDAKSSGSTSSKPGGAKGPPADVSPLPSAALVDAVSSQVVDRLGDLLEKKLAAALSGASASGVPPPGARAPPRSLAPGVQRTPQAGSGQAAAAPPPPPSPTPFGFSAPFGSGAQASGQSVFGGAPPQGLAGLPPGVGGAGYPPGQSGGAGYPGAQSHAYAAAGVAGYGNPGLAPQLPAGGLADPIPHQDLRYPLPERLARRQAQGFVLPVELWQDDEYERVVPGFSKLSPGHQSEVAYGLVSLKRVDDVLGYIEAELCSCSHCVDAADQRMHAGACEYIATLYLTKFNPPLLVNLHR
eukprot:SAG31_NODE_6928_length_1846_cov_65.911276_1_plen_302_part_00